MEVVVDLIYLSDVLVLHFPSCQTLSARSLRLREDHLVNHYVVNVNLKLSQFNSQSLCLVETQKLRNADCDEGSSLRVFELAVDLHDLSLHSV